MGEKGYLRIFIGSPGDVEAERNIAYKVINDVEEIFRIFKERNLADFVPPLCALGWEKVAPNVGLPNQVILEKFPIEASDIFIFILWAKFGTPPGTRDASGHKYSSGTEQEFLEAFEQRRKSANGRPVIMLYRRTDDFPLMAKGLKEIKQYGKIVKFFSECEPSGKHPTTYYGFKANEFESLLRRHLLDNILKAYKPAAEDALLKDKPDSLEHQEEAMQTDHAAKTWLEQNNLSSNPFHDRFADDEDNLARYYVRFKNLQHNIEYLLKDRNNWIIFGREGSGKTALRKFLFTKCQNDPQTICVEYSSEDFLSALAAEEDPGKIAASIATQICQTVLKVVNIAYDEDEFNNTVSLLSIFSHLKEKLKSKDIGQILILVDPFKKAVENTSKVSSALAQLTDVSINGIGLRFFLPKNIYITLSNRLHAYIGRCTPMEIEWDFNELQELIRQRLIYYSKDKRNVNFSMGALGEPRGGMDRIDQAIIGLSEKNPRAVIWLADQLISKHCQNRPIPLKIERQTWDQVQEGWWNWGRNHILGLPGHENEFWQSGSDVFFKDKRLDISKHSKILLSVLIEADGQICSKEKLMAAGWSKDNKEGVTEAALREAMRRLKNELPKKQQGWLRTIHGQGYRLQDPNETEV